MKNLILLLLIVSVFAGCNKLSKTEEQQAAIYGSGILKLIESAAEGSVKANDSLSSLFNLKLNGNKGYNHIIIDSIINYKGKRIYLLLMEYPIPVYNRFAIYDEKLRCFLMDKSLNGYLKSSVYRSEGEILIQVDENFISKDEFEIMRRSLYLFKNDTTSLAFRNYMELKSGNKNFIQDIVSINKDSISTTLNLNGSHDTDLFLFDSKTLKYISKDDKFLKSITSELEAYKKQPNKPQIFDERSALEAAGQTVKEDTINNTNNYKNREEGFSVFIPEEWKVIKNFAINGPLKKTAKGTYFTNMSKGAKLYIIKLNESDSAETYTDVSFSNFVKGKYFVRFIEKIEKGNSLYSYFEISCTTKKFLLFFEIPKLIYEDNKQIFESIINSFAIDC